MTEDRVRLCEQKTQHGGDPPPADCYAIDPHPDGWGGNYCFGCADKLNFQIVDIYNKEEPTT